MAPFYEECCRDLGWNLDKTLLEQMKSENESQIKVLSEAIDEAQATMGESEIREANLKKAEYHSKIGDKVNIFISLLWQRIKHYELQEEAIKALVRTYDKTVSLGQRLDLVFHQIRIGLFYLDHPLITRNLDKAKKWVLFFSIFINLYFYVLGYFSLIEEGGDWDRRNRLKVYEGIYSMAIRDFKKAANLFLDTISTFTSYELKDYNR